MVGNSDGVSRLPGLQWFARTGNTVKICPEKIALTDAAPIDLDLNEVSRIRERSAETLGAWRQGAAAEQDVAELGLGLGT